MDSITISQYCVYHSVEPDFIFALAQSGLLIITDLNGEQYIAHEYLPRLEKYTRLYYEMDINVEGIEVIDRLLSKIEELEEEREQLKMWRKLGGND